MGRRGVGRKEEEEEKGCACIAGGNADNCPAE